VLVVRFGWICMEPRQKSLWPMCREDRVIADSLVSMRGEVPSTTPISIAFKFGELPANRMHKPKRCRTCQVRGTKYLCWHGTPQVRYCTNDKTRNQMVKYSLYPRSVAELSNSNQSAHVPGGPLAYCALEYVLRRFKQNRCLHPALH